MLHRAEHDMLNIYEAHHSGLDVSYKPYRKRMKGFLAGVGCKLGWDNEPYEVERDASYDAAFYETVLQALISSVKQTLAA
jgi:hypothetical protein